MKPINGIKMVLCPLLVALTLFMASCTHVDASASKTVVVLLDVSGSTQTEAIRSLYMRDFRKILQSIEPGDAIAADRIAENSSASSSLPVNHEFEGAFNSNRFKVRKAKNQILKATEGILTRPGKVRYTDIIGSLSIAERVFRSYEKERNVIVIMSDMIEDSATYNFQKEKLTDARIDQIIEHEKSKGLLPDLNNVQVYAVKSATQQSREVYESIERFWLRYFKECGATLERANYGPLTKFE